MMPATTEGRLLERIDCTDEYGHERCFANGAVRVIDGPAGRYREAEGVPLSRFGYRFAVRETGRPHALVITFPDDRRRFMCIQDGTGYDLSTGVHTGFAHPLSGGMRTVRQVFWPRWTDCSVVFMTWGHDEPAAAASIEVYELDDLPAFEPPSPDYATPRRAIGIQYEDPCGTGAAEGAASREEWMENVLTYARHSGQDLLAYPIVWYHGPHYPSEREPVSDFDMVVAADRRQYVRWTSRPADWFAMMLDRAGDAGVGVEGVMTLLRLGSLMERMNIDQQAVDAGAETINAVRSTGHVQAGTQDWTPTYNVRNYDELVANDESVGVAKDFQYAYGEKTRQPYPVGPMFNVLHPTVQDAIRGLVREIAERYGSYKAFRGVRLSMWAPAITWFGSLRTGYDDLTISLFEQETGVSVPGEDGDPGRFAARYEFLTSRCRSAWIAWRCAKVRDLMRGLRDELRGVRSDLVLGLDLWSEPFIPAVIGSGGPEHQLGARPTNVELFREGGIDPALYEDESGIRLTLQLEGGGRDRGSSIEEDAPLSAFTMYRDHDYLDGDTLRAVAAQERPSAFIFNAWHEAWGKHRWFPADADDDQARDLAVMGGEPAEGIFRVNSEYPDDGFWWDSQLRITPAFPAPQHFLEPYAHALAELDALEITRGGLFLDKAHTGEIAAFARAYRALPAVKFKQVGPSNDPVAVRTALVDGQRYVYAVNRDHVGATVELSLGNSPCALTDLASGESIDDAAARFELGSYELRSFTCACTDAPTSARVTLPDDARQAVEQDAEAALNALRHVRESGRSIPGADSIERGIVAAIEEGRFAWLRRALTSYPVLAAQEPEATTTCLRSST